MEQWKDEAATTAGRCQNTSRGARLRRTKRVIASETGKVWPIKFYSTQAPFPPNDSLDLGVFVLRVVLA